VYGDVRVDVVDVSRVSIACCRRAKRQMRRRWTNDRVSTAFARAAVFMSALTCSRTSRRAGSTVTPKTRALRSFVDDDAVYRVKRGFSSPRAFSATLKRFFARVRASTMNTCRWLDSTRESSRSRDAQTNILDCRMSIAVVDTSHRVSMSPMSSRFSSSRHRRSAKSREVTSSRFFPGSSQLQERRRQKRRRRRSRTKERVRPCVISSHRTHRCAQRRGSSATTTGEVGEKKVSRRLGTHRRARALVPVRSLVASCFHRQTRTTTTHASWCVAGDAIRSARTKKTRAPVSDSRPEKKRR